VIEAGKVRIEAITAPGHRPEHLALLVTDTGRSPEPQALLSGDSLLVGDLARPDLAVDAAEGAADLHATLARLASLPDHVELWPGHTGGSLCGGAGLSPKPSSTLGFERRAQALLAERDVEAFTASLTASLPNRPPTVERVVARNRSAHPSRRRSASEGRFISAITPGFREEMVIVDGRPAEAFDAEHVRGAISLPLVGNGIGTRAGWVLDPEVDVVVTATTSAEAAELARRLRAVGLDRVRDVLPWGALRDAGPLSGVGAIEIDALPPLLDEVVVVDVRDAGEWERGHVPDSVHLPLSRLRDGTHALPRDRRLAVACAVGGRAAFAASWLRRVGHDARRVSGGGIPDLLRLGVPLVT
jgi:rhodanese-related sulfurtransferase